MNAAEANAKTISIRATFIPSQYDRITLEIQKNVESGKFYCVIDESLYPENKELLIEQGFKVKWINDYRYKITWV